MEKSRVEIMEVLIKKKNLVWDSQILSTLMSCARLSDFRFNLRLTPLGPRSKSLEKGSIVHVALEYYYKNIIQGLKRHDAIGNALIAAREYVLGCPDCLKSQGVEVDFCTRHKEQDWIGVSLDESEIQIVFDTIDQYFEFYKADFWTPLEVEIVKGKQLYEDDEVRIAWKAKFDLISDTNHGIYPVDHKTHQQRRDTLSLNNQFIGQCIVAESRNVIINKIGFQTSVKPADKFTRPMMSYSMDRLIEWQSEILPYWAKLYLAFEESGYWPPNFTHCENKYGICIFKEICEANPNMREEDLRKNFRVSRKWDVSND
jgi:hypothetical protein